MATHCIVLDPNKPSNDTANLDISADDPNLTATYQLYVGGDPVTQVACKPTANNFVTNASDLIAASAKRLCLCVATTGNASELSDGVLRQGKLISGVPSLDRLLGFTFGFPLGDVGTGATLYIANPGFGALPAGVVRAVGSTSGTSLGNFAFTSTNQVQAIPLTLSSGPSRIFVQVQQGSGVMCQVIIQGHGREADLFFAQPL